MIHRSQNRTHRGPHTHPSDLCRVCAPTSPHARTRAGSPVLYEHTYHAAKNTIDERARVLVSTRCSREITQPATGSAPTHWLL